MHFYADVAILSAFYKMKKVLLVGIPQNSQILYLSMVRNQILQVLVLVEQLVLLPIEDDCGVFYCNKVIIIILRCPAFLLDLL